jgi:hypothetical protein
MNMLYEDLDTLSYLGIVVLGSLDRHDPYYDSKPITSKMNYDGFSMHYRLSMQVPTHV